MWTRPSLCLLLLAVLTGCTQSGPQIDETEERAYRRGQSLKREGRPDEALLAFLTVIDSRPQAPESHLEAGLIYLEYIKDPLAAIYHFRRYLEMKPQGEHAPYVEQQIVAAKKDFARTLPGNPLGPEVERLDLLDQVKALEALNNELKQDLANTRSRLQQLENDNARLQSSLGVAQAAAQPRPVAPVIVQPAPTALQPGTGQMYTVVSGDTLSAISRKVYGTPNRWNAIFEANQDVLSSPTALRPGMQLRIP